MAIPTTNTYFHIRQELAELRFDSLSAFLAAHPGETYESLAKLLGGIAPAGIVNFQHQTAKKDGGWAAFVRDVLVRDAPVHLAKRGKVADDFVVAAIVRTWAANLGGIPEGLGDRIRDTFSGMLAASDVIDISSAATSALIDEVVVATETRRNA